jgi:hypothetical protein
MEAQLLHAAPELDEMSGESNWIGAGTFLSDSMRCILRKI